MSKKKKPRKKKGPGPGAPKKQVHIDNPNKQPTAEINQVTGKPEPVKVPKHKQGAMAPVHVNDRRGG